ncbi:hypothetical protein HRbin36_02607 [bacterium HR36]|nr:hypothetical protein HRbin36_02607 [bacterium HR36]
MAGLVQKLLEASRVLGHGGRPGVQLIADPVKHVFKMGLQQATALGLRISLGRRLAHGVLELDQPPVQLLGSMFNRGQS